MTATTPAPAAPPAPAAGLRRLTDAATASLIAFLLAIPFIGLYTYESGAGLAVGQRWSWAFIAAGAVFVGRFALGLYHDWRASQPRPAAVSAEASDAAAINRGRKIEVLLSWAALGLALTLPFLPFSNRFIVDLGITVLIYVMLGWGLNVVVGLAGLLDLGYVAFYAVGAYSYALFNQYFGWSFWACLPIAGLLAASFGVTLGFPVLRLRGDYLAIVTLGFGEIIRIFLINWSHLTGGPNGIASIPRPTLFGMPFTRNPEEGQVAVHQFLGLDYSPEHRGIFLYFIILALALLTNLLVTRLRRLPIGRAWEALREDEIACMALGINPTNVKLSAFGCGAMLGGFAGAFFATRQGFISPESFTFIESAIILAVVVLGGMGSQIGVVAAALFLVALPELAREFAQYRMLLFGLAMILVMVWRPAGLLSHRIPTARLHAAPKAGASA